MTSPSLRLQGLWLYGVVVALALEAALSSVVPNVIASGLATAPPAEAVRLIVFLLTTLRFYLGAVTYFDDVYELPDSARFDRKSWGLDFFTGTLHFLFFLALAYSIDLDQNRPEAFPLILSVILLWDVAWFGASLRLDTHKRIQIWTVVNVVTWVIALVAYLVTWILTGDRLITEQVAYAPIVVASLIDLAEIIRRRPLYKNWISGLADDSPPARAAESTPVPADCGHWQIQREMAPALLALFTSGRRMLDGSISASTWTQEPPRHSE